MPKKQKPIVDKAIKAAKELEKIPMPTRKEILDIYKDGLQKSKKLQKLLKPAWFVKDTDKKGAKKRRKGSTRRRK